MAHGENTCDSEKYTLVTFDRKFRDSRAYFRHSQKAQTSQHRQRPTQYAHTGDFTVTLKQNLSFCCYSPALVVGTAWHWV